MREPSETVKERVIRIGPDRVTVTDNEVAIETKHEMPDWEVRSFQAPAIYFEEKKYLLVEKGQAQPPYSIRYILRPWPAGKTPNPKLFHTYDQEAVADRDSTRRSAARGEFARAYLLMFYPFLGLLWSGAQKRLVRIGFVPRSITGISIFSVFGLLFVQGVFVALMLQASARSGKMMVGGMIRAMSSQDQIQIGQWGVPLYFLDCLLTLALLTDVTVRYTCYLRDDEWVGGFLEWLVPKSLHKS